MTPLKKIAYLFAVVIASSTGIAHANEVTLSTADNPFPGSSLNQGWWSPTISNNNSNTNYFTGTNTQGEHNSFFTFSIPTLNVGEQVLSAQLRLRRFDSFATNELSETLGFFDVTTDAATLNANVGTSPTIFSDLGSGVSYGEFVVDGAGPSTDILEFNLNSSAVFEINAAQGGFFSIGGSLLSNDGDDAIFSASGGFQPQELVLTLVPEPTSVALVGLATVGLGASVRRRRC